jgi:hypothetical protein
MEGGEVKDDHLGELLDAGAADDGRCGIETTQAEAKCQLGKRHVGLLGNRLIKTSRTNISLN